MESTEIADGYIRASGQRGLRARDARILEKFVRDHTADYCRSGCAACELSCPLSVPIADVLRQRMYAKSYGNLALARTGYAKLGDGASACLSCSGQLCVDACVYGLNVPSLTWETAALLGNH
jgi:predicted aldo/keto reductase-like oxidoreductase